MPERTWYHVPGRPRSGSEAVYERPATICSAPPGRLGDVSSPKTRFIADWTKLWQLAERIASPTCEHPDFVFMPIGLRLENPAQAHAWDYPTTPINVAAFASTGGDGVHFSVINTSDARGPAPVVMTVPMALDNPNHIVGNDLREFLALGRRTGYSCLERLAYPWGRPEVITQLQSDRLPPDIEEAVLLGHLTDEFDLHPWRNIEQRLEELDAAYRRHLVLGRDAPPS
jgi:hypothetical protein